MEQIQVGARVKVRAACGTPKYRGMAGTVMESWGLPQYAAFTVYLENGRDELFWHYELEEEPLEVEEHL